MLSHALSSLLVLIYQSFFLYLKFLHLNILIFFKREILPHDIVKSFCESVVALSLQICLTQSPAIILINDNFVF